jgi:hypothetical protein
MLLTRRLPFKAFAGEASERLNFKLACRLVEWRRSPTYCRRRETIVRVNSAILFSTLRRFRRAVHLRGRQDWGRQVGEVTKLF